MQTIFSAKKFRAHFFWIANLVNPTENHIDSITRGKISKIFSGPCFSDLQNFKGPNLHQAPTLSNVCEQSLKATPTCSICSHSGNVLCATYAASGGIWIVSLVHCRSPKRSCILVPLIIMCTNSPRYSSAK